MGLAYHRKMATGGESAQSVYVYHVDARNIEWPCFGDNPIVALAWVIA